MIKKCLYFHTSILNKNVAGNVCFLDRLTREVTRLHDNCYYLLRFYQYVVDFMNELLYLPI